MTRPMLPNFIQKAMSNGDGPPSPSGALAASPIEAANALGKTVADLLARCDQLTSDLEFSRKLASELEAELNVSRRDADHYRAKSEYYERFTITLMTNLDVIRNLIDSTHRRAQAHARNEPAAEPEPETSKVPPPPVVNLEGEIKQILAQTKETEQ